MALDRLTKVDGGGISTTSDYRVGVITATKFVGPIDGVVTGSLTGTATTAVNAQGLTGTPDIVVGIITASSANFSGNVSIGGTLTYEDVTNIDSVGIITAQKDIHVGAGVSAVGVGTFGQIKVGTGITIGTAGVGTFTSVQAIDSFACQKYPQTRISFPTNNNHLQIFTSNTQRMRFYALGTIFLGEESASPSGNATLYLNSNSTSVFSDSSRLYDQPNKAMVHIKNSTATGGGEAGIVLHNDNGAAGVVAIYGKKRDLYTSDCIFRFRDGGSTSVESFRVRTTDIQVGTGVTIETNGQATFVGIVTFGSSSTTINGNTDTVNVGTALTLGHSQGLQYHTQNLHAQGFEVNQINASGIITASSFRGPSGGTATFQDIDVDGHTNLDNVSIAGVTTVSNKTQVTSLGIGIQPIDHHHIHIESANPRILIRSTGTNASKILFGDNSSNDPGVIEYHHGNNQMRFTTNNDGDRLVIESDGKLQTNTSGQVAADFTTSHSSGAYHKYELGSNGAAIGYIGASSQLVTGTPVSSFGIRGESNIIFGIGNSEKLRITSSGLIGVNNNNPDSNFRVDCAGSVRIGTGSYGSRLQFSRSGLGDELVIGVDGYGNSTTNEATIQSSINSPRPLVFATNNTERLRILSNGNIEVATTTTTSPAYLRFNSNRSNADDALGGVYGVWNGNSVAAINFKTGADTTNKDDGELQFVTYSGGSPYERIRITSDGKVGINQTPSTGVDIGNDVHIRKGSGDPSGEIIIQTHDTANATAGIQLLARRNDNVNETCRILATSDSGSKINLRLYTDNNSNKGMRINGSDGGVSFVGSSTGTLGYTFQNATGDANSDTRVLIKTYANYGADPYVKFDSGGTNMVVGQLYGGGSNNKLVLGAGESPSGGVTGIHVFGDGDVHMDNNLFFAKGSDPRIYAGSSVGLNIDGQALYLNRYVNSTIAMARGGGPVEVSNTTSGNDAQLNVYKSTGNNSDKAILRVGYNADYCYAISRQRNSGSIILNQTQAGGIAHHQNTGDDTMLLTNRNSVHIAKLAPMVIASPHIQSNATWGASRPFKFVMRFSTGGFSSTFHVARMITQRDWGFTDWEVKMYRDYYSPSSNDGSTSRYTGYYDSHTDTVVNYNQMGSGSGTGAGATLSRNTNLGPGGSFTIHQAANGGYYRDAYATDYYVSLGNYSGVTLEVTVKNPGGWLKDQATSLSTIYPAAFNGQASQSDADSWSYGRGLWFNVRQGVLDTSWWGYSSNFGQQNLPTS